MRKSSTDLLQKLITIRVTIPLATPVFNSKKDFLDDRCCRINFLRAANETTAKIAFTSNKDPHNYSFTSPRRDSLSSAF
jgi:hypothetical protein